MTNNDANKFAFDSFVTAFTPGNEQLIDQYFDSDLVLLNHSVSKQFGLNELKSGLSKVHTNYQDIKSEIQDVIVENDRIAFHVKQMAFSVLENKQITLNIMNLYKLSDGKVKEWQIWENFK
jgi:limonene-1,2-epoxide hydrolase